MTSVRAENTVIKKVAKVNLCIILYINIFIIIKITHKYNKTKCCKILINVVLTVFNDGYLHFFNTVLTILDKKCTGISKSSDK